MSDLLTIEELQVQFQLREGVVTAVEDVSISMPTGKVLALVGESGCGKSVTAKTILGLLPVTAKITRGRILLRSLGAAGAPGGPESTLQDEAVTDIAALPPKSR